MNIHELLHKLNIDFDNLKVVQQLAKDFEEWCYWNKSYETIEVFESAQFPVIIVVHDLFDDDIRVIDSWEFISNVKYLLKTYAEQSEEDCKYMLDFWEEKVKRLNEVI